MPKSLSVPYVRWFHDYTRSWVTWEPGKKVEPGVVGIFDDALCFRHYRTLRDYGIPYSVTEEQPEGDRLYATEGGFQFTPKVGAKGVVPAAPIVAVQGSVSLTSKRANACLLQAKNATSNRLQDLDTILQAIQTLVVEGTWRLDLIVVVERIRALEGFAVICSKKGTGVALDLHAAVEPIPSVEALGGSVSLGSQADESALASFQFSSEATPIFTETIRIRQTFLGRLLGQPPQVIDPTGTVFQPTPSHLLAASDVIDPKTNEVIAVHGEAIDERIANRIEALGIDLASISRRSALDSDFATGKRTVGNLAHLALEDRLYNPDRSEISRSELEALPPSVLFETLECPVAFVSGKGVASPEQVEQTFIDESDWLGSRQGNTLVLADGKEAVKHAIVEPIQVSFK